VLLRATLERVTHRIVIRRHLPLPFHAARVYTSSEGGLRYLRPSMGRVDPALLRLAAEVIKPGDVVWDIGANLGLFTFAAAVAAGQGGHVVAVEPDAVLVRLLRRSAALNCGQAPVDIFPAAVADNLGVGRFNIARATEMVPTVSLDWLATHFPAPDVVKIDVEEAEVLVLTGSASVLRMRPIIICEVAGRNAPAVRDLLAGQGYTLYDGEQAADQRISMTTAPPNTLAINHSRP
jgi:FkbM family methyltransferase